MVTDHGIFLLPGTNAHGGPDKPQHVYSVRFSARELWGEDALANDSLYIDLFDDYMDPDLGNTYYHHWLAALEDIVAEKRLITPEALTRRRDEVQEEHQRLHGHSH